MILLKKLYLNDGDLFEDFIFEMEFMLFFLVDYNLIDLGFLLF